MRSCREFADMNGIDIVDELVFSDSSVRGCRTRRPGFTALRAELERGEIDIVLIFSTNRLYRKTYKSLQFVEEEIVDHGIRCVFVRSGIDTADSDRWRQLLHLHAMMDEMVVHMGASHIRAAHEGMLDQELVHGTVTFGYQGAPVSGQKTKKNNARRRFEIDPVQAEWVRKIFAWYVEDGLSIGAIIRKLNREKAPLPPKCTTGQWTYQAVRLLLGNQRYDGFWAYGVTKSQYLNKQDNVRQVARDEPLRTKRIERLRIVDHATWLRTQERLANEPRRGGRTAKTADRKRRPEFLNGMLRCEEHQTRLHVGGPHGRYYFCPICKRMDDPALYCMLNRELAWKIVSEKCASLLLEDSELVGDIITCAQAYVERAQRPDPGQLKKFRSQKAELTRRIQFILANGGTSTEDQREDAAALVDTRGRRASVQAKIGALEGAESRVVKVPTNDEIRSFLDELAGILQLASESNDEESTARVRRVIELITGGIIDFQQMGERKAQRGWLQGTFRNHLLESTVNHFTGGIHDGDGVEVAINFQEPTPADQIADEVKRLCDEGHLIKEIAVRLSCSRNLITKALKIWYERQGESPPDGRTRRSSLKRKHREPPKYQLAADAVKRLADTGLLMQEIAEKLSLDRNTVTKAWRFAHEQEGTTAPDRRYRRRSLARKTTKGQWKSV
ncbi:MAG: hypothetical protein DHS20C16_02920 [Phycisphaerae bacterium]|nr:MAG: hypothetical protein DHS20C16_02920 [Phycisphaerae bacterium]